MFNPTSALPTEFDLPDSDNKPVDNELQILIPTLLRAILSLAWQDRNDWFIGINLGLYHTPHQPAIGPDAFLSLGVPKFRANGQLRLSYVVWTENHVMPQWVLEIVSKQAGGEYDEKFHIYEEIGVLYYVIYNPDHWKRDRHDSFEVYRLVDGQYQRQQGNPVWMPEIGLGIGVALGVHEGGAPRNWLYWYDEQAQQLPIPENMIAQERQRAEQERQRAEQAERQFQDLLARLQERGIDPDNL
ncbi:MAG: Uma2 family endonuclease [Leptolyngbyaceae cyanobacterium CSU_1_4]|nr:Uma2 family endonuclease [Leptolyngbyaceae cyanobacterium CSU_1_4]